MITLPTDLAELLRSRGGLITTADLASIGIRRGRVVRLLHHGLLAALARGVYTTPALLSTLDDWTRYSLRSRAFAMASPADAVAAGWSAIALHNLPHLGRPPALPGVIRRAAPPRGSDRSPRGWTKFASLDPQWVVDVDGIAVLHPAVATIDIGRRSGRLATLVVADAVARPPGGRDSLRVALDAMRHWPGSGRAGWAVAHADGDCESPLETIGRFAILGADLPAPMSNVWVGIDRPRYRLDHYWAEHRFGLEGDGLSKYRMAHGGGAEDDALLAEKDREFELRQWGVATERYTWRRALFEPGSVAERCKAALSGPLLPAHPGLRCWPAAEGYRLRGMAVPNGQLGAGPDWRELVRAALHRIEG